MAGGEREGWTLHNQFEFQLGVVREAMRGSGGTLHDLFLYLVDEGGGGRRGTGWGRPD